MFLHPRRGLMSRGPTAQTVNGDITVRAPGLSSSAVPVMGLRPRGLSAVYLTSLCRVCTATGSQSHPTPLTVADKSCIFMLFKDI